MNILLTCAGRRHYLAQYFKDFLGSNGNLVGADMVSHAPALAACDKVYETPAIYAENYLRFLIGICNKENIDFVFSLNDLELQLIADNLDYLSKNTSARFVVSSSAAIEYCSDKLKTFQFCTQHGIRTPRTYIDLDEAIDLLQRGEISFPLIVKPRWGSASIGIFKVNTHQDLQEKFAECKNSISNSLLVNNGRLTDAVIIQEFIRGSEYGVDVLNSLEGQLIGFSAKLKLSMRAGETDKSITVEPQPFSVAVQAISQNLGHVGNLDCDFLERDGELFLLEMNPRFGGGYPFTHMAGANHISLLLGHDSGLRSTYDYKIGQCFAKCDILVDLTAISASNSNHNDKGFSKSVAL